MRYFQKCVSCGHAAFEYKTKPKKGDPVNVHTIIHRDNPQEGQAIKCQVCKVRVDSSDLSDFNILKIVGLEGKIIDVEHIDKAKKNEAGWKITEEGENKKVMFYCPACKDLKDIKNHSVDEDGNVAPEVLCGCGGYHEEVRLVGWPREYVKEGADPYLNGNSRVVHTE